MLPGACPLLDSTIPIVKQVPLVTKRESWFRLHTYTLESCYQSEHKQQTMRRDTIDSTVLLRERLSTGWPTCLACLQILPSAWKHDKGWKCSYFSPSSHQTKLSFSLSKCTTTPIIQSKQSRRGMNFQSLKPRQEALARWIVMILCKYCLLQWRAVRTFKDCSAGLNAITGTVLHLQLKWSGEN